MKNFLVKYFSIYEHQKHVIIKFLFIKFKIKLKYVLRREKNIIKEISQKTIWWK